MSATGFQARENCFFANATLLPWLLGILPWRYVDWHSNRPRSLPDIPTRNAPDTESTPFKLLRHDDAEAFHRIAGVVWGCGKVRQLRGVPNADPSSSL